MRLATIWDPEKEFTAESLRKFLNSLVEFERYFLAFNIEEGIFQLWRYC